jgi:hypothetical protein
MRKKRKMIFFVCGRKVISCRFPEKKPQQKNPTTVIKWGTLGGSP